METLRVCEAYLPSHMILSNCITAGKLDSFNIVTENKAMLNTLNSRAKLLPVIINLRGYLLIWVSFASIDTSWNGLFSFTRSKLIFYFFLAF